MILLQAKLPWRLLVYFACLSLHFVLIGTLISHCAIKVHARLEHVLFISIFCLECCFDLDLFELASLPWASQALKPLVFTSFWLSSFSSNMTRAWRDYHQRTYQSYSNYCLEAAVKTFVSDFCWVLLVRCFWHFHHHCDHFPIYFCQLYTCEPCLIFCGFQGAVSVAEFLTRGTDQLQNI